MVSGLEEPIGLVLVFMQMGLPDLKTTKTGRQGKNTRARLSIQVKRGNYLC